MSGSLDPGQAPDAGRVPDRLTVPYGPDVVTELEVKRSRFITWLRRAEDEAAARRLLADAREAYPVARHQCSAWVISVSGAQALWHSSDDGEPSGTAGRCSTCSSPSPRGGGPTAGSVWTRNPLKRRFTAAPVLDRRMPPRPCYIPGPG